MRRVLSSAAKMSEILDCNVSVVEDLHKIREPLPLVGVYFVQPTSRNVERILADFPEGEKALYQSVHIFFSSQVRGPYALPLSPLTVHERPLLLMTTASAETGTTTALLPSKSLPRWLPFLPGAPQACGSHQGLHLPHPQAQDAQGDQPGVHHGGLAHSGDGAP